MLAFRVFDSHSGPGRALDLTQAYAFGQDDVPISAAVIQENDLIRIERTGNDAAGLALQMAVRLPDGKGSLGMLVVQTCLLPDRAEPYTLSLELARHRIMLFLNKLEDWDFFDLAPDDPVMQTFERARQTFTNALVTANAHATPADLVKADSLAQDALALAIDAGERLTLMNAQRTLPLRQSGQLYARAAQRLEALTQEAPSTGVPITLPGEHLTVLPGVAQIGCAISPVSVSEPVAKALTSVCDFVTMPMRWLELEPGEGEHAFGPTDRWIEWAVKVAKIPVVGGPLLDFRINSTPDWLYIWENDYETLREMIYEHVQTVVTRYRRTISRWTICSGLNTGTSFKLSPEQIMDLTRSCAFIVRKLHPQARIQVEISQPWGEYFALNRRSVPPLMYADTLIQAGVPFDIIALRLQLAQPLPGQMTRDLMSISAMLDRFASLDRPIAITAVGCPSEVLQPAAPPSRRAANANPFADEADNDDATVDSGPILNPGSWRKPWNEATQADWLAQVVALCAAKPGVASVCWQDMVELTGRTRPPEMPGGGLITSSGAPKAALAKLALIRAALRDGRTIPVPSF
jgi:hypothetical protein